MATVQTIAELHQALKEKKGQMAVLRGKQAKAAAKLRKAASALNKATAANAKAQAGLKAVDGAIAALAGKVARAKAAPKKARRKKAAPKKAGRKKAAAKKATPKKKAPAGGLAGVLVNILAGKAGVAVPAATKLVLATGYKTQSKQFQTIVNQTLLRDPRFVKVSRGVYALKGAAKPAPKEAPAKKAAPKKPRKKAAPKKAAKKPAKKAAAPGSLKSILIEILTGKEAVSIADATAAVLATGYKSKAKKFSLIVNQMLAKNPAFKQVGRGKYGL